MAAPRVLCIDDHQQGLDMRKQVLEQWGYEAFLATDGPSGLRLLAHTPVDVVLLDYRMPDMQGDAVAQEIKRDHPNLPIVLLSGYPTMIPEEALHFVDAFFWKGQQSAAELKEVLARLTGQRAPKPTPREALEGLRLGAAEEVDDYFRFWLNWQAGTGEEKKS